MRTLPKVGHWRSVGTCPSTQGGVEVFPVTLLGLIPAHVSTQSIQVSGYNEHGYHVEIVPSHGINM